MANQNYESKPFIYASKGLAARWEPDRTPEGYYLNFLNVFERSENSISSRYGTSILNRDPYGTPAPASNYFFPQPVISLAKMVYQGSPQRYAGLADGSLWQRNYNSQGPYTKLALPFTAQGQQIVLSGQPFQTVISSCYETSLPFLFIYDADYSIKIAAGSSTPQLTGIDPSPYTLNANPYAPLLIMIDSFAQDNGYTTTGIIDWGWGNINTLAATSGRLITDFSQFYGISPAGGGGTRYPGAGYVTGCDGTAQQINTPGTDTVITSSGGGFASVVPASGEVVTIYVTDSNSWSISGAGTPGTVIASYQCSPDGGTTWVTFDSVGYGYNGSGNSGPYPVHFTISTSNLGLVQFRIVLSATVYPLGSDEQSSITADISSPYAVIYNAGAFGPVANGMLALLNTNVQSTIPIAQISSANYSNGIYTELLVQTTAPHHLSASDTMAIYASSNDLVDGFYQIAQATASNSFLVPFQSATQIGAAGGYVTYTGTASNTWAAPPPACVLTSQYSTPYPSQMSAWGFYEWVPPTTTTFPISAWSGTITASSSVGTVGISASLDLDQNNQVTDADLIVLTILTSDPANIAQAELRFFIGAGTNNYYSAFISPAYFQGAISGTELAYQSTQNQILADALGLITGQTPGTTSAQLQPTNISTGAGSWIACLIPRGNFLPVGQAGQAGLDWANVSGWQLSVTTNANGGVSFSCNGLYLQWGYGPSSFGGIGYDWRQTYYDAATGTESSPCPPMEFNHDFGYLASTSAPFFLRQAAQVTGQYSSDPQVSHVRLYRRGGILASNWLLAVQAPNVTGGGQFLLKDVIGDAFLMQAQPLALDNDPPVTSNLVTPIQTVLTAATTLSGLSSIYSTFLPQTVTVAQADAVFVPNMLAEIGNANNLEVVAVITGSTGQFTAILRLEHNQGEPVSVYATPRQACSLCAISNQGGVTQVWLAGDPNNPHYLYYSKPGLPENFSPAGYIAVSSPDDPIMAVINWRGTIVVGTTKTFYIIVGGAKPYAQPTGAAHGMASTSWTLVEGEVVYTSQDGLRAFSGADGVYMTLPVEWMFRASPATIIPKFSVSNYSSTILCQYQQQVYASFVSASDSLSTGGGARYRLRFDHSYKRFGLDDVPATAMLWEQDTNALLVGKQISATGYAVVQDWVGDYDDGGWNQAGTALVQTPIHLAPQTPYHDLGKPHFPKQWNMLEGDYNTQGQDIQTTLLFNTEPPTSLTLPAANTGTQRGKVQYQIPAVASASNPLASGVQAYAMSVQHDMYVTVAPTLYQEDVYAVVLADYRTAWDSYWQKIEGDYLGILPKNIYCDYTSTAQLVIRLFVDGSDYAPYYIDDFTLIPQANRATVRVQLPARKGRLWRVIITSTDSFQLWSAVRTDTKPLCEGSGYAQTGFPVYQ